MNKTHILAEIRRTATDNSGVPLGVARFRTETGIKVADWHGKYWSRWGDAVKEAGFEPNALREAYSDETVLQQLAEFVRELGKLPVRGEFRLKRRADSTFPNEKVFDRFGSTSQLAAKLAEHCRARFDMGDVVAICERVPSDTDSTQTEESASAVEIGSVYLLKSGRHYKIGKSNAAGRRERELAIQLPEKAKTVHIIRTDDPNGIEAYWHSRFAARRLNGEWFDLTATDINAFKRRKFM